MGIPIALTLTGTIKALFAKHSKPLNEARLADPGYLMGLIRSMRSWTQFSRHKANDYFISEVIARVTHERYTSYYRMEASELAQTIIMIGGMWEDDIIDDLTTPLQIQIIPTPSEVVTWYWLLDATWGTPQWVPIRVLGGVISKDSIDWPLASFLEAHPDAKWGHCPQPERIT